MANWTTTHHPSNGVTVRRDGVTMWSEADARGYTVEAWGVLLRELQDCKVRMYAAEDAHREALARAEAAIPDESTYLGDGVYIVVHPNGVTLYTERENGVHMISLEPWMIQQLARMVAPTPGE